jgi:acylphosphatase
MNKRVEATIFGRVQGVNFRAYTVREARRLALAGWVANQPEGTVRVVAEGPEENLTQLIEFLHRGSPAASVYLVRLEWGAATGEFSGFAVR